MKRLYFLALCNALALSVLLLWIGLVQSGRVSVAAPALAPAAELRVCPTGPPACDYASLQAAVDAASDGDALDGLTITGGDAKGAGGIYVNGGARVTIRNCTIRDNTADESPWHAAGGGVTGWGEITIEDSRIVNNRVRRGGAGESPRAAVMAQEPEPDALATGPSAQTLGPIIEVEWSRVYSGTLDGVVYSHLYWGGIVNSAPTLVDIDGDGDLDLFVRGSPSLGDDELHFFRNDGTTAAPVWTYVTANYFGQQYGLTVQFADLDGDGDLDAILADWPWEPEGFIYYENTGSASEPAWALRTTDMLGNGRAGDGGFALTDIDGDGDLDLFFITTWEQDGDPFTSIAFYENTGLPSTPVWTFVTDTYADIIAEGESWQSFVSIAFADLDDDGDLDLFLGETDWIRHYRNDGTASAPVWTFVTDRYGGISLYESNLMHYVLTFGDLDGNGTLDLIIGHTLGWLSSFKNTGTPANASWELWVDGMLPMDFGGAANPALADIDNDGDLDLLLGVGWGLDRAGLVFVRNDGTPSDPLWTYVPGNYGGIEIWGWETPTFVDINGDGDLDLFIGTLHFFGTSDPGTLYFYENTGTPEVPVFTLVTDTYLDIVEPNDGRVAPAFADIDGDGDQDLFVAVSRGTGQVRFYRNDGNATSPVWTQITDNYMSIQAQYVTFADADGDGDLDMFTDRAFYRNDGDAVQPDWVLRGTPYGLAWSGGPPVLGDLLDNDGRPDLLLGGNGGVHLYRNVRGFTDTVSCHVRVSSVPGITCNDLQTAIDAAQSGDTLKVAGTCAVVHSHPDDLAPTGVVTQVAYIDKSLSLQGGYTTTNWLSPNPTVNPTTLDALGLGRVLYVAAGADATVEGLRITGGDATGLGGAPWGWDAGGGVYATGAWVHLKDSQVFSNTGSWLGGGLAWFNSGGVIAGNVISANAADYVGGAYLFESEVTVSDNVVSYNTAGERGGGLLSSGGDVTYERNLITHNSASEGGGLALEGSHATIKNNVFAENSASSAGTALFVWGSAPYLAHNTFAHNTGGDGSGVYVTTDAWTGTPSTVELVNTILASHSVGINVTGGSTVTVDGILWHNTPLTVSQSPTATVTMQNELVGDPAFAADGYHLLPGSAAVDAGVDAGVGSDLDLDLRPIGAGYDLGADELPPSPATVTSDGGMLVYNDVGGGATTLQVPPGAVPTDTTVILTPKAVESVEELPGGLAFGGRVFELEAYQNGTLVLGFARAVTLTVEYTDADVVDVFEDTLKPYRWTANGWALIGTQFGEGYTPDVGNNRMIFYLLGLSRFGHFAVGIQSRLYLPVVLKVW